MTDKELREIKRRWRPDKCNVSRIVGCFVNSNKEIIARISQGLGLCDEAVSERLLGIMKKAVSGTLGTNLNPIEFSTKQVTDSAEHKLLMELRNSELRDGVLLERIYEKIIGAVKFDGNFVILLANDIYDVTTRHSDGEVGESTERFSYILCAICPLKDAPETLTFREADSLFHASAASGILASPEIGFMFPAFDNRSTNIYNALYYTKSTADSYGDLTRALFDSDAPMPQKQQRAAFSENLGTALGKECDLATVKALHGVIGEMIEAHKESRDPEPLLLTKHTLKTVLEGCGVGGEEIEKFGEEMDKSFGQGAAVSPKNIVATNRFEVKMPEVKITVSPEYRDLISTREIGGERYVTIRVSGPVEINGITLNLDGENAQKDD